MKNHFLIIHEISNASGVDGGDYNYFSHNLLYWGGNPHYMLICVRAKIHEFPPLFIVGGMPPASRSGAPDIWHL